MTRDFPLQGISLYNKGFPFISIFDVPFCGISLCKGFPFVPARSPPLAIPTRLVVVCNNNNNNAYIYIYIHMYIYIYRERERDR